MLLCPAGLTSRPDVRGQPVSDDPLRNPYTVQAQAKLALQLAMQLGVRQVVLAGHTDGALIALEAAASACRWGSASPLLCNLHWAGCCNHAAALTPMHLEAGTAKHALGLCLHRECHEGWRVWAGAQQPSASTVFVAWSTSVHGAEMLCVLQHQQGAW